MLGATIWQTTSNTPRASQIVTKRVLNSACPIAACRPLREARSRRVPTSVPLLSDTPLPSPAVTPGGGDGSPARTPTVPVDGKIV